MKKNVLMMASLLLISSASFASQSSDQNIAQNVAGDAVPVMKSLGFNEYRDACLDPAKFHNQIAPSKIQVSCHDEQLKWQADPNNTLAAGNSRQMTATIFSEKYSSNSETGAIASADQMVACPRFKQVLETVESVNSVSCSELVAYTGSAVEFCQSKINALRTANPLAVQTTVTGKVIDACDSKGVEFLQH